MPPLITDDLDERWWGDSTILEEYGEENEWSVVESSKNRDKDKLHGIITRIVVDGCGFIKVEKGQKYVFTNTKKFKAGQHVTFRVSKRSKDEKFKTAVNVKSCTK